MRNWFEANATQGLQIIITHENVLQTNAQTSNRILFSNADLFTSSLLSSISWSDQLLVKYLIKRFVDQVRVFNLFRCTITFPRKVAGYENFEWVEFHSGAENGLNISPIAYFATEICSRVHWSSPFRCGAMELNPDHAKHHRIHQASSRGSHICCSA